MDKIDRQNRVREALGRIYEQQPPYFREYLRRFREDPTSRVFAPLAEAYRRMGRLDEAIDICREGLGHHPDFHGGRVALAKCYIDKKMWADARVELERVVQAVPENLLAQRLLGDVYLALRNPSSALHCYKMALLLSPNDVALAERVHQLERQEQVLTEAPLAASPEEAPIAPTLPPLDHDDAGEADLLTGDDIPPLWSADGMPRAVPEGEDRPEAEDLERALTDSLSEAVDEEDALGLQPPGQDIESLFGESTIDDDAFKTEHVSAIFDEEGPKKEITTETLGDLYLSQGQFDRALRIFEKLRPTPELTRKIERCRISLGVDHETAIRKRQIAVLKGLLKTVQAQRRA